MNREILVSITTTSNNWKEKIKEANRLNIKKAAIFLTGLEDSQEEKFFRELGETTITQIPFAHLKSTSRPERISQLIQKYGLAKANIHSLREFPESINLTSFKKIIYIENTRLPMDITEINNFAGVCLDFSHLEADRLVRPEKFKINCEVLKITNIGCNHVSAIRAETCEGNKPIFDHHHFMNLDEFNYLNEYPLRYFSDTIAIELENPISEQLEVKEYLGKLIANKEKSQNPHQNHVN